MNNIRYTPILPCVILAVVLAGCGQKLPEGLPKLYPTTVTIIQDEKPLAGAGVLLLPLDSQSRWASGGETNSQGIATLKVHGKYPGAGVGAYKLCVVKTMSDPVPPNKISSDGAMTFEPNTYNLIDPRFADITQTQEVEVRPESKNAWTIDVGKSVKILIPKK